MAELEITGENFEAEVLKSDIPVLVDFWAEWCAPCRMISPIVSELAEEYTGKMKVGKLNVDEHGDLAAKYNIQGIPTLLIFKDGEVAEQIVGVPRGNPKKSLKEKIDEVI